MDAGQAESERLKIANRRESCQYRDAMTIDIKSLAAGLLLGIAITLSIAANMADKGTDQRFELEVDADSTNYYVLDSRTGEVWRNKTGPKLK